MACRTEFRMRSGGLVHSVWPSG